MTALFHKLSNKKPLVSAGTPIRGGHFIIIFSLFIFSCNNNCSFEKKVFSKQLETKTNLKDLILIDSLVNQELSENELFRYVELHNFSVLNDLAIYKVLKIDDRAMVITFKRNYKRSWLDKKLEVNLKTCEVHLVYSNNIETQTRIINFEQFLECRTAKETLANGWVYLYQFKDCN